MLQCAYLLYLSFSLECLGKLSLTVNHFSSTSALASRGQGCPWHYFLGCHDHHCLLHMRLWALAWASGPVQKVDVDHWALWPHNSPSKSYFLTPQEERKILISSAHLFIVTPYLSELPNSFLPSQGTLLTLRCPERTFIKFWRHFCPLRSMARCKSNYGGFLGVTSGNFPACNFSATINSFSNQLISLLSTNTQF